MDNTTDESPRMDEWAVIAATRGQIYGFLGALYTRLPDEQFISGLFAPEMGDFLSSLAEAPGYCQDVHEGASLMQRFVEATQEQPADELKTKVNVERTRLFRGVKPGYGPLPPYESVYTDAATAKNDEINTYPIAAVAKAYADAGAMLPTDNYDQPDYIGFELDFMRHLCARESAAWELGDVAQALDSITRQQEFLNDHLAQWIPRYCAEMCKDARLDLYQGIARITRGYLADEVLKSTAYRNLAEKA